MTAPGAALVSVVVPAYNAEGYLAGAVRSVLAQTWPALEVVVVDDGSSDGTTEVARSLTGDRVRLLRKENGGVASARNLGILHSRGQYVAFLDADDEWHPEKLRRQVEVLEARPEVGLCYCDIEYFDDSGPVHPPPGVWPELDRAPSGDVFEFLLFEGNAVPTSTVVLRRTCLEAVGLFDESPEASEDYDLWLRVARRFPFHFLPERLVRYRVTPGGMTRGVPGRARRRTLHTFERAVTAFGLDTAPYAMRVRRRRGRLLHELGYELWVRGDGRGARRALLRALVEDPRRTMAALHLLAASLPPSAVAFLRQSRDRFRSSPQGKSGRSSPTSSKSTPGAPQSGQSSGGWSRGSDT